MVDPFAIRFSPMAYKLAPGGGNAWSMAYKLAPGGGNAWSVGGHEVSEPPTKLLAAAMSL